MKERFVKPDIYFTEFVSNQAVSACDVTTYKNAIEVDCLKTTSEWVYDKDTNNKCEYDATSLVYYAGGKTDNVIEFLSDGQDGSIDGTYNSGKGKELQKGYYLFWTGSDGLPHGGIVGDTTSSSIKNHS